MQRFFSSLRVRLMLLVAIAMLPTFGLVVYSGIQQRDDKKEAAGREAELLTQTIVARQDQYVDGTRQFLGVLVGLTSGSSGGGVNASPEAISRCNAAFAQLLQQSSRYANLGIADANGTIFCSGIASDPVDAHERTWFQRAVASKTFAIGDYQIETITHRATVNFGYPTLDSSGNVAYVMYAALDLAWLNDVASQAQLPEDASLTIVDREGVILVRYPDPDLWIGQTIPDAEALTANGEARGIVEGRGVDGIKRLYAYAPLGGGEQPNAYLRVGLATSALYAEANQTLQRNLSLLGGVTVLALLVAWFAGGGLVVRKVNRVVAAAQRLRNGDLQARTGLKGSGELDNLGAAFDDMAETLERRQRERDDAERALAEKAEQLTRSNAELEQFAYVASHDLQEPLRMVASYTQLLARRYEGRLDSDADEFINFAVDGATRMQTLINDLLTLSRVGTRGGALEPANVEEILGTALHNLELTIGESHATVTHDALPDVVADAGQLVQLFQNLIGNAMKFHGEEPPRIHISAQRAGADWVFSVADNGIGVEPQYAQRIFVMFQRLHGREEFPGTGIGLAICKKIVERHGGRIWLETTKGGGATFLFTLRAAPAAALATTAKEAA